MRNLLLLIGVLVIGSPHGLRAAPAAPATPTLADYRATYEREKDRIRTNSVSVLSADGDYLKALEDLAAEFKKQGDFDNTVAVNAERKRFAATRLVPDQTPVNLPPAIDKAQAAYRSSLAQATAEREKQVAKLNASYVKALKALIKAYLAEDKMSEAEAVNKEMRLAEAELAKLGQTAVSTTEVGAAEAVAPEASAKVLPPALLRGLVLHYSFDKDEGNGVTDRSPERNSGTVHGARWTAEGKVGGACEFNGVSDFITVKPKADLAKIGDFTVSLWTRVEARKPQVNGSGRWVDRQYIFDAYCDAATGQARTGFFLVYDFAGSGVGEIHNGMLYDAAKGDSLEQNTRVDVADAWHHMIFGRRGTDDYTYLDGNALDSTYAARARRNTQLNLNHTWCIGTYAGNKGGGQVNYSFKGLMDEIMVFKRALTDAEVTQLYNAQK